MGYTTFCRCEALIFVAVLSYCASPLAGTYRPFHLLSLVRTTDNMEGQGRLKYLLRQTLLVSSLAAGSGGSDPERLD